MPRPRTSNPDEKKTERITPVTWATVAEKKEYQQYAADKNLSLAGWLKMLAAEAKKAGR